MGLFWFRNPPSIIGRMPKQKSIILEIVNEFFNWIKSTAPFIVYDLETIAPDYLVGYIAIGENSLYFNVEVNLRTSVANVKIEAADYENKKSLGLKKYKIASFTQQCNIDPKLFREDYSSLVKFEEGYEPLFKKIWESVKIPNSGNIL